MPKHIHFLGIAGIGVSALAQLAQARGIQVSGSDPNANSAANPAVARLAAGGAKLYTTHVAENLADDVDLVVAWQRLRTRTRKSGRRGSATFPLSRGRSFWGD